MSKRFLLNKTYLSPEVICEIINSRGMQNAILILTKKYHISRTHIYVIWKFADMISN